MALSNLKLLPGTPGELFPGFAVSVLVAATAQFLSEHYGAPAMLLALLLGLALNFLADEGTRTAPGIAFTARTVLRLGVALLGARISVEMLARLGWPLILLVVTGVVATILFALLIAPLFGRRWRFALLTGGSVAICGASAAMAIAAVLPRHERSERDLVFTVLAVTVLSTVAMVLYPMLSAWLGFDQRTAGVFLGGTIHDVAQVVGAGFSVGPEAGETATLVKLIRVSMLAPVVLTFSLAIRGMGLADMERAPLKGVAETGAAANVGAVAGPGGASQAVAAVVLSFMRMSRTGTMPGLGSRLRWTRPTSRGSAAPRRPNS